MACTMGLLYLASARQTCLLDWALAGLFFSCSSVLQALAIRLQADHFLVPGLGNTFYLAGHFGILAGLRRHLGLRAGWDILMLVAALTLALHVLPVVHLSVTNRLFLFAPLICAINLAVVLTLWNRIGRAGWQPFLPLVVLEVLFMAQLGLRSVFLLASEPHALAFMHSQFLRTSGSMSVLVFLTVVTMSCALIVSYQQEQALRRASLTDALTGWLNRRALHDTAARAFGRAPVGGAGLCFIIFDIDHFKAINDRYGHGVGDAAIRHVTALSARVLRGHDGLFRIGGEEFAVMVGGGQLEVVCRIAERLRELVAASPLQEGELTVPMTVSVGVAQGDGRDQQWENILRRADEALYYAKQHGRNRVAVHGRDLPSRGGMGEGATAGRRM